MFRWVRHICIQTAYRNELKFCTHFFMEFAVTLLFQLISNLVDKFPRLVGIYQERITYGHIPNTHWQTPITTAAEDVRATMSWMLWKNSINKNVLNAYNCWVGRPGSFCFTDFWPDHLQYTALNWVSLWQVSYVNLFQCLWIPYVSIRYW